MNYGPGRRLTPTKTIDTCLRSVDVSEYARIFDHPIVLQLMEKSQLSFGDRVFPGGTHSRYEHTAFIFHFTYEETERFLKKGFITKQQARDVRIGSIVHDVGHAPFSHTIGNVLGYMINPVAPKIHNDRSAELLRSDEKDSSGRTIRRLIELYGGDFEKVVGIVEKKAPESSIISHHTLGTDKGYILVDSHHTGYHIDIPPFFLDMFDYVFYNDGEIGISEEKKNWVESLQTLIQKMYTDVYFNPKVKQFSRFVEKAVELEINSGRFKPEQVWDMSEDALTYLLKTSGNEDVRNLMKKYSRNELFDLAMKFKINRNGKENYARNSENIQHDITRSVSDAFIKRYGNPLNLTRLERKISNVTGIPFVDLQATLSADPKRVMPQDTAIYTPYGEKIGMLFEMNPSHYNSLIERAEDFFALRVNVNSGFKKHFRQKAERVNEIIMDDVNQD